MSRIRSSGTTPEIRLYEIIRQALGARRRIHRNSPDLPGQPDLYVPSLRLALFADGCFYHSCPKHGHNPKSNKKYWVPKLARNRRRDKAANRELKRMGIEVWRVWECALKGANSGRTTVKLERRIRHYVRSSSSANKAQPDSRQNHPNRRRGQARGAASDGVRTGE